jgi:hypothetical protein
MYVKRTNVVRSHNHFAVETQQCILCVVVVVVVVELRATVNYIKMVSAAQQCFYGKIITPANMGIILSCFSKKL